MTFGEKMTRTEKLARTAWISYLIAASPVAIFCACTILLPIRFLFVQDIGPVEAPPLPNHQKAIIGLCMLSHPVAWILGLTIAHRFNREMLKTIPFMANSLPMAGIVWFASTLARDEGREFVWIACYTGILLAMLVVGIVAAFVSTRQRPESPNSNGTGHASTGHVVEPADGDNPQPEAEERSR